jgi:hypothetical protein
LRVRGEPRYVPAFCSEAVSSPLTLALSPPRGEGNLAAHFGVSIALLRFLL